MYTRPKTAGYSFIEVLVSIAILLVSIVGPLTIASTGLQNATFAREQNTAFFLAQEGIEGVLYLRERAGLQHFQNNGIDTWSWTSTLPSNCFSGNPCRIDIDTFTISECNPVSECNLHLHSSGSTRYRHTTGGELTPYSRKLYFEMIGSNAIYVQSVVEWQAGAFGELRSVALETYLYDIYGN